MRMEAGRETPGRVNVIIRCFKVGSSENDCCTLTSRLLEGGSRECTCERGAIMNVRRVTCDINKWAEQLFVTGVGSLVLFILLPGEVVYCRICSGECMMSVIIIPRANCSASGRIVSWIPIVHNLMDTGWIRTCSPLSVGRARPLYYQSDCKTCH